MFRIYSLNELTRTEAIGHVHHDGWGNFGVQTGTSQYLPLFTLMIPSLDWPEVTNVESLKRGVEENNSRAIF